MPDDPTSRSLLEIVALPGPQTTLSLAGEVDPATAPLLEARFDELAEDGAVSCIIVDVGAVTFLDSSGIRVLVAARAALEARSTTLVLRNPNANIRRILEITGLTQLISVE